MKHSHKNKNRDENFLLLTEVMTEVRVKFRHSISCISKHIHEGAHK